MRMLRRSKRTRRAAPVAYAALLALAGAACGDLTGPARARELREAKHLWLARRPATYTMTVSANCFCVPEVTRPVVARVSGDSVQSRRYADTGDTVDPRFAPLFPSIDGLFAALDSAFRRGPAVFDVEYHPSLGYPAHYFIDYEARAADDEFWYTVHDLRAP